MGHHLQAKSPFIEDNEQFIFGLKRIFDCEGRVWERGRLSDRHHQFHSCPCEMWPMTPKLCDFLFLSLTLLIPGGGFKSTPPRFFRDNFG